MSAGTDTIDVERDRLRREFADEYKVARRKGFEPLTPRFEVWCSIQLSYRRLFDGA
jgi:hypothetical protein